MKRRKSEHNVPEKANKILNGILVVLLLVAFRVWFLAVVQHEEKLEEALKPQERIVVERAERATIVDRFGVPLAVNKVQYNAAICYTPIRSLPRWRWEKDEKGKRKKYFYRKEYITRLSQLLASELHLDPERIEDLVHSKAAILGNVPCVIKENISEKQYFRLKMAEKDWPGIQTEIAAKREYPFGLLGGEVIGYTGPISREKYDYITREMAQLRECITLWEEGEEPLFPEGYMTIDEVSTRLSELEKTAYSINDFVGKAGVEATYDESLRGSRGKRVYLADTRGNFLRELEGSKAPEAGERLELSLSVELQKYAEQLLAEHERFSPGMLSRYPDAVPERSPWIKGGAIVVMKPQTGEVVALASFPRFDPNDFIQADDGEKRIERNTQVNRWLETPCHLADLWDMKTPLTREYFSPLTGNYQQEALEINWEAFLRFILPEKSPVRRLLDKRDKISDAIHLQRRLDQLVSLFEGISHAKVIDYLYSGDKQVALGVTITIPEREYFECQLPQVADQVAFLKEELAPYFSSLNRNYDKLLLADLYRVVVDARTFSPYLNELVGSTSLKEYRETSARLVSVKTVVRALVRELFHQNDFKAWRESCFKEYLAEKRREEKAAKRKYARPYLAYLNEEEERQFSLFWDQHQWAFVVLFLTGEWEKESDALSPYVASLASWVEELSQGAHSALRWAPHYHSLQHYVGLFSRKLLIDYLQTMRSFDALDRSLVGRYRGLRGKKEQDLAASFYPTYGFGYARSHAFRQATTLGSIFKLVPAYEALCQQYLKGKSLNLLTIIDDKHKVWGETVSWNVGFFLDGRTIPMFYKGGRLPRTDHAGVGRVDLVRALETSSNPYFSMLSGDVLDDPEDLVAAAQKLGYGSHTGIDLPGEYRGLLPTDVAYNRTGLYSTAIGQHTLVGTPLQSAVMLSTLTNGGHVMTPHVARKEDKERWPVYLPTPVQGLLIKGLKRVITGSTGTARSLKHYFPEELLGQIVGKTSTGEAVERVSLDEQSGFLKVKHIGFASVAYEDSQPDLVVIVYLRHGDYGKDVAPLAVQMIQKWREIKKIDACWH